MQAAKRAFAAYASKAPDQASAFLSKVDGGVRDKLSKGLVGFGGKGTMGFEGRCLGDGQVARGRRRCKAEKAKAGKVEKALGHHYIGSH